MAHFICTGGCGGVAEAPGMCKAEDCPFYAEELQECHCTDGTHEQKDEAEIEEIKE